MRRIADEHRLIDDVVEGALVVLGMDVGDTGVAAWTRKAFDAR